MKYLCLILLVLGCCAIPNAYAEDPPGATVIINSALVHNFLWKLLPLHAKVQSGPHSYELWVADLYYCGPKRIGTSAIVLGVIHSGQAPKSVPAPILLPDDCNNSLDDLSKALKKRTQKQPNATPFIVSRLSLSFEPWTLSLRAGSLNVKDATIVGKKTCGLKKQNAALSYQLLASFSTAAIKVNLGGDTDVPLDTAIAFDRDSMQLTFYPANSFTKKCELLFGSCGSTYKYDIPVPASIDQLSSPSNSVLRVPYTFANTIVSKYLPQPFFKQQMPYIGEIDFVAPTLTGGQDSLRLSGTLEYKAGDGKMKEFPTSVEWAGQDLKISNFVVTPAHQSENCLGVGVLAIPGYDPCEKINQVFTALALAMKSKLQEEYAGRPLRPASYNQPVSWTVFGIPLLVHTDVIQSSASEQRVEFREIVALEKK